MPQGERMGGCLDTGFSKILPEAKSVFIQMYNCFVFKFYLPKLEVKRNVQKSHVLTGRDRIEENGVIYGGEMMVDLYLCTDRKCLHGYLSHS